MSAQSDFMPPWGAYAPSGSKRFLALLIKLGLSHGVVKKILQKLWFYHQAQEPVDVEYSGVKFRLQPWDNVVERKILFGSRVRDGKEIDFLRNHLNGESVFLDIGANIGYYSCMLAASGVRRIVAVEPHPVTRRRLEFNINANGFMGVITVAPFALGETGGEVMLSTRNGDLGSSSIGSAGDKSSCIQFTVEMLSLYAMCQKLNIAGIDAIKIDVEGIEDKILIPFLNEAPASVWPRFIIIEHAHSNVWGDDLFGYMDKCGYKVCAQTRANAILQRKEK